MRNRRIPDPREDLAIDGFWNELVASDDRAEAEIDRRLEATLRVVQQVAAVPPPRASRERVDRDVLAAIDRAASHRELAELMVMPGDRKGPSPQFAPNGSGHYARPEARGRRYLAHWQPALASLATVSLIVLAITALVAIPQLTGTRERLRSLPAITAILPSAEQGIITETLFDVPNVPLPDGYALVYLAQFRLQPGVSSEEHGLVGTIVNWVEQGTPAVRLPEGERPQAPGKSLVIPVRKAFFMRNSGQDEAIVIQARILDASATTGGPSSARTSDQTGRSFGHVIGVGAALPGGSGTVTLERLTVPPGAALPPATVTGLDWFGIAAGRAGVSVTGDQLPFRWDPGEERTFGVGQYLPALSPGVKMTLRNVGDSPLVLYHLTISPG